MQTGRPAKQPPCDFGRRLREAREAKGLSQAQVAEHLQVTQKTYSVWERRDVALKPAQISKLATILDLPVEALFGTVPAKRGNGPAGKARLVFEKISALPRRQQQKIVELLEPYVREHSTANSNSH